MVTLSLSDWLILFGLSALAGLSYFWRVSKKRNKNVAVEAGIVGVFFLASSLIIRNII